MWLKLRPFRILYRIASLLEENNQLLRELHVALTGHQPQTIRRTMAEMPRKIRTAKDVFFVGPTTEAELIAQELAEREKNATQNDDFASLDPRGRLAAGNAFEQAAATNPTDGRPFDTNERG